MTAAVLQVKAGEAVQAADYDEAIRLYTKALEYLRSGSQQADAGTVYLNLAQVEHLRGEFAAGEASYKHALKLFEQHAPPNDWRRVSSLDGLGWLYVTMGRRAEASSLLDEAKRLAEHAKFAPTELIRHLDTQAAYLVATGRYSEAQKKWRQGLEVAKSGNVPDVAQYDYVFLHAGQASALYGDYAAAAQMFRRFLEVDQRNPAGDEVAHALAAAELGHAYIQLGKPTDAAPWFDQAREEFRGNMKRTPLIQSIVLSYLGDYYMITQNWGAAKTQYERALTIRERILGDTDSTAQLMMSLSAALRKLHAKNEAKELDLRAKSIVHAQQMPKREQTVDILALRAQSK